MEEKLTQIFNVWGWKGLIIIALVFILSFLIKWPLKNWAVKQAELGKIADKKVITKWFFAIPIVVSFILVFICELWFECGWDAGKLDWAIVSTGTATFAVAPAAIYEWFDNFYKSGQATALVKEAVSAGKVVTEVQKAEAEQQAAKVAAKREKLEAKKLKLQKRISSLSLEEESIATDNEPKQKAEVDKFGNATFK